MDIVEELSRAIDDGFQIKDVSLLKRAKAEIERLRSIAGAITPGPSFQEIRTTSKVLKAFDGA